MKARNAEAQRLEAQYLAQLRLALADRSSSESAEILQSVRDHIDEALEEAPGDEVTAVTMGNLLERLGPPEAFAQEDDPSGQGAPGTAAAGTTVVPPMPMAPPRVSKLAVASALALPVAGLAAVPVAVLVRLVWKEPHGDDVAVLADFAVLLSVLLAGAIVGVAGLVAIRNSAGRLRGKALAYLGIGEFGIVLLLGFWGFLTSSPPTRFSPQTIEPPTPYQSAEPTHR